MPCDTIQTTTVAEKLEGVNIGIVELALKSLGFGVTKLSQKKISFSGLQNGHYYFGDYTDGGKLEANTQDYGAKFDFGVVQDACGHQAVQLAANAYGWTLIPTGKNTYDAVKQGY